MSDQTCNLKLQKLELASVSRTKWERRTNVRLVNLEKVAEDIRAVKFAAYGIAGLLVAQTVGIVEAIKLALFGV